jgi:hypothetical protein
MNDTIITIDAFANGEYKNSMLRDCIKQFKKFNLPIFLISNSGIDSETQELLDYYFFDKNDLKYTIDIPHQEIFWWTENSDFMFEKKEHFTQPHGLSVLKNLNTTVSFVKQLGFKNFIHFEWDFFPSDEMIEILKNKVESTISSNKKAFFYKSEEYRDGTSDDLMFYFWFSEIDFWEKHFVNVESEEKLLHWLKEKHDIPNATQAEKVLYASFKNVLDECKITEFKEFEENVRDTYSRSNIIQNDLNFATLSKEGGIACLAPVYRSDQLDKNTISIFSWNRGFQIISNIKYKIKFKDKEIQINHSDVPINCYKYDIIDFTENDFPVQVEIDDIFKFSYEKYSDFDGNLLFKDGTKNYHTN